MSVSQTFNSSDLSLDVLTSPKRAKDYVIIVLLSLIGICGTISCILSDNTQATNYTVQSMSIGEY